MPGPLKSLLHPAPMRTMANIIVVNAPSFDSGRFTALAANGLAARR